MTAGASLPANGQDTPKDPERGRGHHENRPKSHRPGPRTHRTPTDQRFLRESDVACHAERSTDVHFRHKVFGVPSQFEIGIPLEYFVRLLFGHVHHPLPTVRRRSLFTLWTT